MHFFFNGAIYFIQRFLQPLFMQLFFSSLHFLHFFFLHFLHFFSFLHVFLHVFLHELKVRVSEFI